MENKKIIKSNGSETAELTVKVEKAPRLKTGLRGGAASAPRESAAVRGVVMK